ncbi:MAG: hypothetical protein ABSD87_10355 [Candidatus Acidiferrales bacterium]
MNSSMVSYRQGPELPLHRETIYEAFAAATRKFPDRPALVARLGGVLAAEADGDAPAD